MDPAPGGRALRALQRPGLEAIEAAYQHRPRCDLCHAALVVQLDGDRYTIELAPSPNADTASRGVVATGAVGSRWAGRLRVFRYEMRCWQGGSIPDLGYAVGGPRVLNNDSRVARRLIDLVPAVPLPVWGHDELKAGEMWNSNSVIAWLIFTADLPTDTLAPPPRGRAPGWDAGLKVARRSGTRAPGHPHTWQPPIAAQLSGVRVAERFATLHSRPTQANHEAPGKRPVDQRDRQAGQESRQSPDDTEARPLPATPIRPIG